MPCTPAYVAKHRTRLNKRSKLSYYNKTAKLEYETIHKYEEEHGLDQTIEWVKAHSLISKSNLLKIKE